MDTRINKKAALYDKEDRISHLPRDVITKCILSRIPLKDAIRTSILSRTWTNMWASSSVLLLDKKFFCHNFQNRPPGFILFVYKILSRHIGPLDEFSFYIPNFKGFFLTPDVDQWLRLLCKDTVKKLHLHNSTTAPHPYNLPPCIFACSQLISLSLVNCMLEPPPDGFGGFCKLNKVHLREVSFSADTFEALVPSATILRELIFEDCSGVVYLRATAPRLRLLHVTSTNKVDSVFVLGLLGSTSRLEEFSLSGSNNVIVFNEHDNTTDLYKLLDRMPKVRSLKFAGHNLKLLSAGTVLEELPTFLDHLTDLELHGFEFSDFDQISCALCLLRSSPQLKNLETWSYRKDEAAAATEEVVVELLNGSEWIVDPLRQLRTANLHRAEVSRAELAFVKLLLVKAPSLENMTIELLNGVPSGNLHLFNQKIRWFPWASAAAEMIIIPPAPVVTKPVEDERDRRQQHSPSLPRRAWQMTANSALACSQRCSSFAKSSFSFFLFVLFLFSVNSN